jgi:CelD/BcsL family acetyltransferase involved in cellulose biosynthesis
VKIFWMIAPIAGMVSGGSRRAASALGARRHTDGGEHDVMLPTRIRATFEMVEAEFGLEFLVFLLDPPALMREPDQLLERRGGGRVDDKVLGTRRGAQIDRLGMAPEDALHIGDRPRVDAEAARRAGMPAVISRYPALPTIELIDDTARFTVLASEWDGLLLASAANRPFLAWTWLHAWWTHLSESRRLAVLTVRHGHELVAIAPLALSRGRLPWFWRYEFLGTGFAGSDYLDLIVRRGREPEAVRALAGYVRDQKLALRLDRLPVDSSASKLMASLTESGWTVRETNHGVCPFIRLEGHSWDSYLATLGSSHRATVRRRINALDRKFRVRFKLVTSERDRHQALDGLFGFHAERWSERGGSTAFHTPSLRMFHHDVTARALRDGWLRLYTLHLNDDLAAVMYGFAYSGCFYFYQHGFDQKCRQHSVGHVAIDLAIRAAIEEGAAESDMLYGDEAYKLFWASEQRQLVRIDVFPAHLGGQLQQRTVEAEQTVRTFARRLLSLNAHGS